MSTFATRRPPGWFLLCAAPVVGRMGQTGAADFRGIDALVRAGRMQKKLAVIP
ncbi:MAG TPA: hypothetical protein VHG72_05240 [Polyangia bacterium]|nr:hypothetical protein [Polyangia bacterium]